MIAKLILSRVLKRAVKKAEAYVAAGTGAVAVGAIVKPEVLEYIPEQVRGYVVLAVVVLLIGKRAKDEIVDAIREARKPNV